MGITVHYRGRIADMDRIEDFEDRVLDLVLELGGRAEIWRSTADHDPQRMVRGVLAHLHPGQETTSLLISPEGWLVPFFQIEEAEQGTIAEPPWCFVKTQFGPVESHVALVEMLAALQREFFPDLEVHDEGGYWESRDAGELARRHSFLRAAIDGLAEGLQQHGLSPEAAEDPEIVIERIRRIAAKVQSTIARPSEHPPAMRDEEEYGAEWPPDPEDVEAEWDAIYREQRRKQERMFRAMEERTSAGEDVEDALENAMRDVGTPIPGDTMLPLGGEDEEDDDEDLPWQDDLLASLEDDDDDDDEWRESAADEDLEGADDAATGEESDGGGADFFERRSHPLVRRAMDLMLRLRKLPDDAPGRPDPALHALFQGCGDMMGGLSQAMSHYGDEDDDREPDALGLRIVQLKRALRGAAFARGALFQLRERLEKPLLEELHGEVKGLQQEMFAELARLRSALRPGDGAD
jgi:hypothetical protein